MVVDDLAGLLVTAGVGTIPAVGAKPTANSIFTGGSSAEIPAGAGPYLMLIETGGIGPTRIQNKGAANTRRPTVQIFVKAATKVAARTMSEAAYAALDGKFNVTINGTFYQKVTARQEPTDVGLDAVERRAQFSFNLDVERNP